MFYISQNLTLSGKQTQQDTNWKYEYETYERHMDLIFDEKTRKKLYNTCQRAPEKSSGIAFCFNLFIFIVSSLVPEKSAILDKGSNEVKKFWSGWCQQYAKSDKNKFPPEAQDFLGMHGLYFILPFKTELKFIMNLDDVLEQKSANWESLENQKQKSNNELQSGRTIEDSLQDAIIQIQEKD
ncbi:6789_t:CDS:2 [Gigaspora margarita]|uniref:6789_t:CDS:1 n=1 Tax=Gigaspora margarita TaxID=4874 RepID=A0ABN7VCQ5_GIGMA|nr:6789_t:CDS:2 [Gigaspora margarita]